jgi:hypothetical protein
MSKMGKDGITNRPGLKNKELKIENRHVFERMWPLCGHSVNTKRGLECLIVMTFLRGK